MARIEKVNLEEAKGESAKLFESVKRSLGRVPNIYKYMGNSPLLLEGFMELSKLLGKSSLSPELKEKIALAVGASNHCNYCLAAHTAIAKGLGISQGDIDAAKGANADDKKSAAILRFAKAANEKRGDVSDDDIKALKDEKVSDQEICEIILAVTVNLLTNTFNRVVQTPVDF